MSLRWLYPATDITASTSFSPNTGTRQSCVDDDVGDPDDDTTYLGINTISSADYQLFGFPSMPDSVNISSVTVCWRSKTVSGTQSTDFFQGALLWIGGSSYSGASRIVSAGYTDYTRAWNTNPATGKVWTVDDLNNLQAGLYQLNWTTDQSRCTQLYLEVDYTPVPPKFPTTRDTLSRRYWFNRRPSELLSVDVTSDIGLDVGLLDLVPVSHYAGPHDSSTGGWGMKNWERRPHDVQEVSLNPNNDTTSLVLKDLRPFLVLWSDDAWATRRGDLVADSIARLDKGNTRTFARASSVWYDSPLEDYVIEAIDGYEAHALNGDLIEGVATNYCKYSSFKDGTGSSFTGWNVVAGTLSKSTTNLLFSDDVSTKCMQVTAGTGGNLIVVGTSSASIAANTVMRLSIDHQDATTSGIFYYSLRRAADGYWWDNASANWSSTRPFNATTPSLAWDRHISGQIDVGTSPTSLTVYLGASGGILDPSQVNYVGHVQLEDRPFATSRIVTGATQVTREAATLSIASSCGRRAWSNDQGGSAWQFITEWNSSEINGEIKTIASVIHDADNHQKIYYDGTSGVLCFEHKTGGVTSQATIAQSITRGTPYSAVTRHTGIDDELGSGPYTVSIFLDGVQGTDATATGVCTEADSAPLEIGCSASTDQFDGQIRLRRAYAYVPTDEEAGRLP